MPYCQTSFQAVKPDQVEILLKTLAQELVYGGTDAYQLDDGTFSIDAGQNDLRAIYQENTATINFFCRYSLDMVVYDRKLQSFAAKHGIASSIIRLKKS